MVVIDGMPSVMFRLDRLASDEGPRLRAIRLKVVADAPDAFDTTFEEYAAWTAERWTAQLQGEPIYVAVEDGLDVGMVRCARNDGTASTFGNIRWSCAVDDDRNCRG